MSRSPEPTPAPGGILVEAEGLACGYPGRVVLADVVLALRAGTVTALLGPNGSGKSTLLKTLAKTLPPVGGTVRVAGNSLSRLGFADLAKLVGYVPQEEVPPFRFTVRQVVTMGRLPHSTGLFDTEEDHAAADEAMALADCLDLQDRVVMELSGGERQRVLIARALAQQASVLLLDEPTAHLDVRHQIGIIRLLRRLAAEGKCVVAAVHDLNLGAMLADDAVLIQDGRLSAPRPYGEVLNSGDLDEAYGVRFRRLPDGPTGRTWVMPEME
ncbi:MAG: ABC transporter ATP-binding protein [Fimbriimonadaceae bacterium]